MASRALREARFRVVAVAIFGGCLVALALLIPPPLAGGEVTEKSASAAKEKALAKCRKFKVKAKREVCLGQVTQRFRPPVMVEVRDPYFSPDFVAIRSGRRIIWDWGTINGDSHNVMLDPYAPQPPGLTEADWFTLDSGRAYTINHRFPARLTKTGTYNFYCSLHSTVMRMKVNVKR